MRIVYLPSYCRHPINAAQIWLPLIGFLLCFVYLPLGVAVLVLGCLLRRASALLFIHACC